MTPRMLARLVHDVGKYIARTARNLPAHPTPEMIDMLVRDLYALRSGQRASAVFAELDDASIALSEVRMLLAKIDTLEPLVRAGEPNAVQVAATTARTIETRLRALMAGA